MKNSRHLLFIPLLFIFFAGCKTDQPTPTPETAVLTGIVQIVYGDPALLQLGTPMPAASPEDYTARKLQIFNTDGSELLHEISFSEDGTYRIELAPGTYIVNVAPFGLDTALDLPTVIVMSKGLKRTLDIIIDTGVR